MERPEQKGGIGPIMKDLRIIKVLKIALGSCIAILLAEGLHLQNAMSAGVITVLSIQNTKKETFLLASKRFAAFLAALIIAFCIFEAVGYHAISFGLFLLIFVPLCSIFKLEEGISVNAVLVTHFWTQGTFEFYFIQNEFLVLLIGVGIGVLLNLFVPKNLKEIRRSQYEIEEEFKAFLREISARIMKQSTEMHCMERYDILQKLISNGIEKAYENRNNTLINDTKYFIQYMQMRKSQCTMLRWISFRSQSLTFVPEQAGIIADFLLEIAQSYHEYNNAEALLLRCEEIRLAFKETDLPVSREEFENRAVLYQILSDIAYFLTLKKNFADSLTSGQVHRFWEKEY